MRRANDPAWLEQQYNNRARVPDYASHLQKWATASAHTRENAECVLDVPYGDGPSETLDVFPTQAPNAPVLVYLHGGYWRALDKSDHSFVAPAFTAAGALVVVPNYALAPAVSIEDITLQMARALEWTWRHAAAHGGDPTRITVAGHSAGGHLAAMMLSCRWKQLADDLPAQLVQGALSLSGLYDLEPLRLTPFLQADLRLTPASVKRLSPAFFPRPKGKLVTLVGALESEEFLRQNQLIRDVWGPTAVPVCEAVPGADHFTILRELVDPGSRVHGLGRQLLGLA
jgi:arylformamidase